MISKLDPLLSSEETFIVPFSPSINPFTEAKPILVPLKPLLYLF
jgi:hypothetical protein